MGWMEFEHAGSLIIARDVKDQKLIKALDQRLQGNRQTQSKGQWMDNGRSSVRHRESMQSILPSKLFFYTLLHSLL